MKLSQVETPDDSRDFPRDFLALETINPTNSFPASCSSVMQHLDLDHIRPQILFGRQESWDLSAFTRGACSLARYAGTTVPEALSYGIAS